MVAVLAALGVGLVLGVALEKLRRHRQRWNALRFEWQRGAQMLVVFLSGLLCLSGAVMAEDAIVITKAGYFLLKQDAAGNPSLVKVTRVIKLDEPPPEPTPNPTTLTERAKAIQAKVSAVQDPKRAETALAMATAYREIAKLIPEKISGQAEVAQALKTANDLILDRQGSAAAWQPVRSLLADQLADVTRVGGADGEYAVLLGEAADGLEATVPQAGGRAKVSPEMLALIMKIIEIILSLINKT